MRPVRRSPESHDKKRYLFETINIELSNEWIYFLMFEIFWQDFLCERILMIDDNRPAIWAPTDKFFILFLVLNTARPLIQKSGRCPLKALTRKCKPGAFGSFNICHNFDRNAELETIEIHVSLPSSLWTGLETGLEIFLFFLCTSIHISGIRFYFRVISDRQSSS